MPKKIISINMDENIVDNIEIYKKEQIPELTRGQYIEVACIEKIVRDKRVAEKAKEK